MELDGKTIKLQIVGIIDNGLFFSRSDPVLLICSGTLLDKKDSEPLQAVTTEGLMESL